MRNHRRRDSEAKLDPDAYRIRPIAPNEYVAEQQATSGRYKGEWYDPMEESNSSVNRGSLEKVKAWIDRRIAQREADRVKREAERQWVRDNPPFPYPPPKEPS